jgi:hypothetical protein
MYERGNWAYWSAPLSQSDCPSDLGYGEARVVFSAGCNAYPTLEIEDGILKIRDFQEFFGR